MDAHQEHAGHFSDGAGGPSNTDKLSSGPRVVQAPAKLNKAAPSDHEVSMKFPKLLGRKNPVETALADVQRFAAQQRKLDGRLADVMARFEAAQAARRTALVQADPDVTELAKLDKACADAAEARAGVEEAARHVAAQFDEAQRTYKGLVDEAKRADVIAACEARADAIDAAAERLADAARIFRDARLELEAAVAEDGIARDDLPVWALVRPIVVAAVRSAAPGILPDEADFFGAPPRDVDAVTTARRVQSGRLRDVADDLKQGVFPIEEPARPGKPQKQIEVRVDEMQIVLRHDLYYEASGGASVFLSFGAVSIPEPVALAAIAAGMAVPAGTQEARDVLDEQRKTLAEMKFGKGAPDRPSLAARVLDFSWDVWLAQERARLQAAA